MKTNDLWDADGIVAAEPFQAEEYLNLDPGTTMPEEVFPSFANQKAILVPTLQSMPDYIRRHYAKTILKNLCGWIKSGYARVRSDIPPVAVEETAVISKMQFWRTSRSTVAADITMSVDVIVQEDQKDRFTRIYPAALVHFDLELSYMFIQDFYASESQLPEHDGDWKLTDHLIPVFTKRDIELKTQELLQKYLYEGWVDQHMNNPYQLAERMGLSICRIRLHDCADTKSILFFRRSSVYEDILDEKGKVIGARRVSVKKNTILINLNAVHPDYCQLPIYHECIHYEWHYLFYRLQFLFNNDLKQIRKMWRIRYDHKNEQDPLSWLEWQANHGSFCLWMPEPFMMRIIHERLCEIKNSSAHMAGKLFMVGRAIHNEYRIPKFRVRARMIKLGYIEAKGIFNYLDTGYVRPFCFSADNGNGQYTFFVTSQQAEQLYLASADFRERVLSGQYVYAEGHFCINHPDYIVQTDKGPQLTEWANAHVDKCCLRFEDVYEQDEAYAYRFGRLNCDEAYNEHYLYFPPVKYTKRNPKPSPETQEELNIQYQCSLGMSFPDTLKKLMKDCKITEERLAEKTGLSVRTISRLRNNNSSGYSRDHVIAIIIALHLPPWVSHILLQNAGINLMTNPGSMTYARIVNTMFMDNIETVQRHLKAIGRPQLNLKEMREDTLAIA